MMGKPKNAKAAGLMLKQMSGHKLEAVTSIAVKKPGRMGAGKTDFAVWSESGWVKFKKLRAVDISHYLSSGQWKGKAAAVNVEERPVRDWIVKKGGEQGAVVGLPLKRLQKELGEV